MPEQSGDYVLDPEQVHNDGIEHICGALMDSGLWHEIDGDGTEYSIIADHIRQMLRAFRERDAAAQHLIGLLRYHLGDHEAAGKDYRPYRDWKALDPAAEFGRGDGDV